MMSSIALWLSITTLTNYVDINQCQCQCQCLNIILNALSVRSSPLIALILCVKVYMSFGLLFIVVRTNKPKITTIELSWTANMLLYFPAKCLNKQDLLDEILSFEFLYIVQYNNVGLASYLKFVIFFTWTKFLENKIYTEKTRKLRQNTQ